MTDTTELCNPQALYNLISDQTLRQVERRVREFNPLSVLGVEDAEIRHSNVLAWLLNPNELHGFGDNVLRKFMAEVIVGNENVPEKFTLANTYFHDFTDAEIRREWNHIDVLAISREQETLLLIENKVWASESDRQLTRYLDLCRRAFPDYRILPVFLTLEGDEPQGDDRYCWFSHRKLAEIIEHEVEATRDTLSGAIADFIDFYIMTIRRALGMDDQLETLCRKIYSEHKAAIDAIITTIDKTGFALQEASDDFIQQHSNLRISWQSQKQTWCVDASWDQLKHTHDTGWNGGYPAGIWFSEYYGNIKLVVEVGPIEPAEKRIRFLEHLEDYGFKIQERAKHPDRKYSRVYTNHLEVNDWGDREELLCKMEELFSQQGADAVHRFSEAMSTFHWAEED